MAPSRSALPLGRVRRADRPRRPRAGSRRRADTVAELDLLMADYRPELEATPAARRAARFILVQPPVPLALRAPYGLLSAAAVAMMPRWTRWPLRLPYLPPVEATAVRASGAAITGGIRWAMGSAPPLPDRV